MTVDYGHTRAATGNRRAKATSLARHLQAQLHTAAEVAAFTFPQRRAAEKASAVRTSSNETWQAVVDLLHQQEAQEASALGRPAPPRPLIPTEPATQPAPAAAPEPPPPAAEAPPPPPRTEAPPRPRHPCGCPISPASRINDAKAHAAFHDLVIAQGGPAGEVSLNTLREARGQHV